MTWLESRIQQPTGFDHLVKLSKNECEFTPPYFSVNRKTHARKLLNRGRLSIIPHGAAAKLVHAVWWPNSLAISLQYLCAKTSMSRRMHAMSSAARTVQRIWKRTAGKDFRWRAWINTPKNYGCACGDCAGLRRPEALRAGANTLKSNSTGRVCGG